jgi:endonuclease/exonuclease/phosphatase (EEP) superfamily protein YafD
VLLALTAIGLAAAYLDPYHFWWAAVVAVLLPYLVILVALAVVALLAFRFYGWAAVATLLLLLGAARLAPLERLTHRPAASGPDFVMMTFSVPRFGESAEALANDVFALLESEEPHLVALQEAIAWRRAEAPGTPRIADYVRPALDSLGYLLAIPAQLAEARTPLPVLTRYPDGPFVLSQREGSLGQTRNGLGASRYLRTHLRWQGREAVLYNVHLRGYGVEKPWEAEGFPLMRPKAWLPFVQRYRLAFRLRSVEARDLRDRMDSETLPVILAGDLNVTPDNWDYRLLSRGMTDAFRRGGRGWGGTYRGDRPLVRIDYVLVDPAFEVHTAHVPDVRFSDHRPVVAGLRWRDTPEP